MSRKNVMEKVDTGVRVRRFPIGRAQARANRDVARTLGGFAAFAGCHPDDLEALAAAGRVTTLPSRWTFLHEGTPADACYVLLDGEALVLKGGRSGDVLGPGSVLGEMGLLGHSLRRASVVTTTATSALHIEYRALTALLRARPRLAECLGAVYEQHVAAERASYALAAAPA